MTELDLEAIKARCEAATPGPWRGLSSPIIYGLGIGIYREEIDGEEKVARALPNDDQIFIAHARTDVPALVAEVERLREQIDEYKELWVWPE